MLNGNLVVLSPIAESDLPILWEWINDRQTALFNGPYRPVAEGAHAAWFAAMQARPDAVMFAIRRRGTNELVGSCQLHSIHPVHRSAELQIRLRADARGQGLGTEATRLLVRFAFLDLNLNRVKLEVFDTNMAAIHVYQKAGFVQEGVLRQAAHIDGSYVDVRVMGILRSDFVEG